MSKYCKPKDIPVDRQFRAFGLFGHADEGNIGKVAGLVAASDVRMRARKSNLLNSRAGWNLAGPEGWAEITSMLIERKGMSGPLYQRRWIRIVKGKHLFVAGYQQAAENAEAAVSQTPRKVIEASA